MSNDDPGMVLLRDALRVAVPVEDTERVCARRQRLVDVLENEIKETPARLHHEQMRSRFRGGLRIAGIAAGLVFVLGAGMLLSRGEDTQKAQVHQAPPSLKVAASQPLLGDFETGAAETRELSLSGKTELSLGNSTRLFVARDTVEDQSLRLSSGQLSLNIPESKGGRKVSVVTPHATVLVGGTALSVEIVGSYKVAENGSADEAQIARTHVGVTKGTALIRHAQGEVKLKEGQTWLSPLPLVQEQAEKVAERKPSQPAKKASTLAHQNALLEQALAAERNGDVPGARALVTRFLGEYPDSPLRGSARAIMKRLK